MSIQGSDCKKIQKKPHSGKLATFTRPEYKYLYLIMAAVDHSSEFSPGHWTVSPGFEKGTSFGSKIAPFRKLNDMSTHVVFGPGTNVAWRPAPAASRNTLRSETIPFREKTVPGAFLQPVSADMRFRIRESESGIRNGECTFSQLWYQRRSLVQGEHEACPGKPPGEDSFNFATRWRRAAAGGGRDGEQARRQRTAPGLRPRAQQIPSVA